jgi:cytidine deaminase
VGLFDKRGFGVTSEQAADLVRLATEARKNAYAPYSRFRVGAAVLTAGGYAFTGCNVENASFGATICAERVAVVATVAAGHRDLTACAVVTGAKAPATPCGICLQVLVEFAADATIVLASVDARDRITSQTTVKLASLLPYAFRFAGAIGGRDPQRRARSPR